MYKNYSLPHRLSRKTLNNIRNMSSMPGTLLTMTFRKYSNQKRKIQKKSTQAKDMFAHPGKEKQRTKNKAHKKLAKKKKKKKRLSVATTITRISQLKHQNSTYHI